MANKLLISVLIGLVAGLVAGGAASYFLFNNHRGFSRGNFQPSFNLNESQINEINSFFSSNPSVTDAQTYCSEHRMNCVYYCRIMNSSNEICPNLNMRPSSGNQPPQSP